MCRFKSCLRALELLGKHVLGYDNKARWKKALGGQYGCLYIDEINIADMEYVREAAMRCDYMLATLNPDDPGLPVYAEYINHARPLPEWEHETPVEILNQLNQEPKEGWVMDPEAVKKAEEALKQQQEDLKAFIKEHNDVLRRDSWRERDDGTSNGENPNLYNAKDYSQYERYLQRIPDSMPVNGYNGFFELKRIGGEAWTRLQENYRYTGIVDRMLEKSGSAVVCNTPKEIPAEYHKAVQELTNPQKDGIYHYSHYQEGVRMNMWLGGVPNVQLSPQELVNLNNTSDALNHMSLPYNTILWRGTESKLLKGFDQLNPKNLQSWKKRSLYMDGFTSTSILKSTSYSTKPIQMVILAPGSVKGAGYIDDIAYNTAHLGEKESDWILQREYEILLQKGARFDIIEAQKFNGKTILVVRWVPDEG